ncbi:MAG: hypothetical protein OHK0017_10180 [Patescibacteria group bacterium]
MRFAIPELQSAGDSNSTSQTTGLLAFYGQKVTVKPNYSFSVNLIEKGSIRALSTIEKQAEYYPRIRVVTNKQIALSLFDYQVVNYDTETQLFKLWNEREFTLAYQGVQPGTYADTVNGTVFLISHVDTDNGGTANVVNFVDILNNKVLHQVDFPVNPISKKSDLNILGDVFTSPAHDHFLTHMKGEGEQHFIGSFNNTSSKFDYLIEVDPFDKLTFSPDGNYFAINSYADDNFMIFDCKNGAKLFNFSDPKAGKAFAFSNNSNYFITNGRDNGLQYLKLWDWKNKKIFRTFNNKSLDEIMYIQPMNYLNVLVLGGRDGTIQFFDLDSEKVVGVFNFSNNDTFSQNPYSQFNLALSEDEKTMVTINPEGLIKIWDISIQ